LAIPQFESLVIIARTFALVNIFFENVSEFNFFAAHDLQNDTIFSSGTHFLQKD